MPRSSRATRPQRSPASHRARGKAPHDPKITRLGITCFRLVATDDAALNFAPIQVASMTATMATLTRPRETWREWSPRRVTAVDRVIRERLALNSAITG